MGKRFKQFLLENEIRYHDIADDSVIRTIIEQLPQNDSIRMIIAKFVLYCAEDVFEFNNDATRSASRNCINLIRKYINDPQSVTTQELRNASANAVYDANNAAYHALDAAWYAAYATYYATYCTAINAINTTSYSATVYTSVWHTAAYAASAAAYDNNNSINNNANIDEKIREQKLNEYTQYLNMLTARYHHSDENTLHKINQLTGIKPQTEQQWFSFLTQIIDELEVKNIIRELPDGSAELYLPFANISANSQLELIDIISRNERMRDLIYSWFV